MTIKLDDKSPGVGDKAGGDGIAPPGAPPVPTKPLEPPDDKLTTKDHKEWLETQMGSLSAELAKHPETTKAMIAEALAPMAGLITTVAELKTFLTDKLAKLEMPSIPQLLPKRDEPQTPPNAGEDGLPGAPSLKRRKEDQNPPPAPAKKPPEAPRKVRYL